MPRPGPKPLAAALLIVVGVLALGAPAGAAHPTRFREVAFGNGVSVVQSDGVRFAWGQPANYQTAVAVRVFDTLRDRNFRLAASARGCRFVSIGGGDALWNCYEPRKVLLQNLSTRRLREPAGVEQVLQMASEGYYCNPLLRGRSVGRYWLAFSCGSGIGPPPEPFYLNHRTGRLTDPIDPFATDLPFIDLDSSHLFRRYCTPVHPRADAYMWPYFDYAPPFALQLTARAARIDSVRLRRCGTRPAEILSRCPRTDCRSPQLGSEYVTWGEFKRVYAYLPLIRRRVRVGRAPVGFLRGRKLSVAHTCDEVFARWGSTIYAARFEPKRGAPRCQR